jgi:integrase
MARRPEIGNVQLYPNRPLRSSDKNGYMLKFYCPIQGKRIRKNCGTRDRRQARRVQRECRERLANGKYGESGGAITAAQTKEMSKPIHSHNVFGSSKSWQEAYYRYRERFKGRSIDDVMSRLSIAERIFELRRREQGLAAGITLQECLNDDGIEYLQERLLAGDESRFDSRSPVTVNSIVRTVMTFAGFCAGRKRKWIERLPEVERFGADGGMKGRPVTGEEFDRLLDVVPRVVGEAPASSWRFALRVLWESTFRIGDLMDFSWDDPQHIYPNWPSRTGQRPTLKIPPTQKNGKEQEVPMLPGLAKLLEAVPEGQRTGWVANPLPIEYELKSQGDEWFMPAANDLKALIADYSNSTIARACAVSETSVRKWLMRLGLVRHEHVQYGRNEIPRVQVARLRARAAQHDHHTACRGSGRLTKEHVSRIIAKIGKAANIVVRRADKEAGIRVKYASAHDLRRGCALRLINAGVSAESLQVIMRHHDFSTTQKFYGATKQAQAAAAEVYEKLAPNDGNSELVGGLMGGHSPHLSLTAVQQKRLKALLDSL